MWIDTGGTFTDCIAKDPSGRTHRIKILSSSVLRGRITGQPDGYHLDVDIPWPVHQDIFKGFVLRALGGTFAATVDRVDLASGRISLSQPAPRITPGSFVELSSMEEVPVLAARLLTHTPLNEAFPPLEMKLGSTRGTNAILESKGARTAFLITKGFKDLLLIGNQQRPDLFALQVIRPLPLYHSVLEVDERVAGDGTVLKPLTRAGTDALIQQLRQDGIESVALSLLNAYRNPEHEIALSKSLRQAGFLFVSASHELSSQIRLLPRSETTVANAYLDPIIRDYVGGIRKGLSGAPLSIMTSSGSLVRADSFFPKDSLLSGPAGGVVGAAEQARRSGIRRILAFDMGGTSTDVSLYDGRYDYRFESRVGALSILSPSLAIDTIAAGGGSICDFDGHRLLVGPHSAGANPGPACYGAGGPLTITDVNLLMGRLDPGQFAIPLNPDAARRALEKLIERITRSGRKRPRTTEVLASLLQIANEKMAEAIRKISVRQGHDPRDFTLLSFGGAGGQHACALAGILAMNRILVPYEAGLLSAYGIGHASVERFAEKLILRPLTEVKSKIEAEVEALFQDARKQLIVEGYPSLDVSKKAAMIYLRFAGQDTSIELNYQGAATIESQFRKKYESIYGHWTPRQIEVESLRVIAEVARTESSGRARKVAPYKPRPTGKVSAFVRGKQQNIPTYRWEQLRRGARISGPALVASDNATTFVDHGWTMQLDGTGNAILTGKKLPGKTEARQGREGSLELFTNRFTAIAQEMGALLQRTSFSVNIKERLDFSCALLDAGGRLVVNAPHIPVHLGSMGVCVREVEKVLAMKEGDVVITNHPGFGGSHLPDITLIKPVFVKGRRVGFVANRAHHAEIGGTKPGSMPADATQLDEEGVIIAPTYLVKRGKAQWGTVTRILTEARFPTRALAENIADLNGALASIHLGEQALRQLCERYGVPTVTSQMKALRKYARDLLAAKIRGLGVRPRRAVEYLDDQSPLRVSLHRKKKKLIIDFTGSSAVHAGNLNATRAIVQSVVLYCLRVLINAPLPMNEGLMENVDLVLPKGLLNPDFSRQPLPAVVGGNTEVSQRLTDTVLKALGLAACSQGTMNNFLFGNDRFGYYETICGGTGAGPGFHGASGVHHHMTNTRITDPEVLEFRYPVRLHQFSLRPNSGGKGKWTGGDGVIREVEFLEALEVNLLTQHRVERPYGMRGGSAGQPGKQLILRADGTAVPLLGIAQIKVSNGDRLILETPGGGGWQSKSKRQ